MDRKRAGWLAFIVVAAIASVTVADTNNPNSPLMRWWSGVQAEAAAQEAPDAPSCGSAITVEIGVCEADVVRILGEPARRSTDVSSRGESRLLVYEGGGNVMRVMVRDGKVTHIQKRW